MLHLHGGDALINRLRAVGFPGDFLAWCDVLCQGPTPAGLSGEEWRQVRADFLDQAYGLADGQSNLGGLEAQDRALELAVQHDEVVMWFGPDFFCQTILLYLLAWFDQPDHQPGRLSLICVGQYPGVDDRRSCTPAFLSPDQLRELFDRRPAVTPREVTLARAAWAALRSSTPEAIHDLLNQDTSALPFLAEGLHRHLSEFPERLSGIDLTERRVLECVQDGPTPWPRLLPEFQQRESRSWMTDLMLLARLRDMAREPAPLLQLEPANLIDPASGSIRDAGRLLELTASLTPLGQEVLSGRKNWLTLRRIDRWVGGVHLTSSSLWGRDPENGRVTRA